ncbi:hypothetical protein [Nocardia tenerifensis]|uniref:hypothetical protein n=1 Tax=Nocardia tenerifensis TaxID=228006 RepID=UPI001475C795|nr:hypothetical protein [Nocardia tenerifensis]
MGVQGGGSLVAGEGGLYLDYQVGEVGGALADAAPQDYSSVGGVLDDDAVVADPRFLFAEGVDPDGGEGDEGGGGGADDVEVDAADEGVGPHVDTRQAAAVQVDITVDDRQPHAEPAQPGRGSGGQQRHRDGRRLGPDLLGVHRVDLAAAQDDRFGALVPGGERPIVGRVARGP